MKRIKRPVRDSACLWALLAGLLMFEVTLPVEAGAALGEFFDAHIQNSVQRAALLHERLAWMPATIGHAVARALHLQNDEAVWVSYQAMHRDIIAAFAAGTSAHGLDAGFMLDQAKSVAHLWQAENHLRKIFLRDTTLGLLVMGTFTAIAGWLPFRLWKRQSVNRFPKPNPSSRLAVTFDHPLDFGVPWADPRATSLYHVAEKNGFLTPLTEKILACFAASPDHPASLQDHLNLPGGLIDHTARTIEAIATLAEDRSQDERTLYLLMALCHDLGKLFAYQKVNTHWIDRRLPHDRISALMVASLPEMYTELSSTHRESLILALRYYHNPEELPTMAPPLSYTLLEVMHKADAIAYEQEKQLSHQQVEAVKPYLWAAFCRAAPQLNINRYRGGYPEGFTSGTIVSVLEHALRERTLDQLPQELQQQLPLRRPSGKLHPAWPFLVEVLKEKHILVEQVQGRKANPSALFNITASGTMYKCVVALSLDGLATLFPEAVAQWTKCPPYNVKIAGGRYGE